LPGVCPMFRKSIAYMTKHHFLFSTDELWINISQKIVIFLSYQVGIVIRISKTS
jgi:hypothetical protein